MALNCQRPDGGGAGAGRAERAQAAPAHAAKGNRRQSRPAGQRRPAHRAEGGGAGMARGGKGRREENQIGAGAAGADKLRPVMRGGGDPAAAGGSGGGRERARAAAQMHPGMQARGKAGRACDHQRDPPRAAEPGDGGRAVCQGFIAQHHAGQAGRE